MTFNENNPGKNAIKMEYAPLSQATACSMHCCLFAFIAVNVSLCALCRPVCVSDLYIVNALWLLLYRIFSAFTGHKKRREKNNWFVVTQQQCSCACSVSRHFFSFPVVFFLILLLLLLSISLSLSLSFVRRTAERGQTKLKQQHALLLCFGIFMCCRS